MKKQKTIDTPTADQLVVENDIYNCASLSQWNIVWRGKPLAYVNFKHGSFSVCVLHPETKKLEVPIFGYNFTDFAEDKHSSVAATGEFNSIEEEKLWFELIRFYVAQYYKGCDYEDIPVPEGYKNVYVRI